MTLCTGENVKRKSANETIQYEHFAWVIYRRGNMFYADGRGNAPPLGRHSLGTDSPEDARKKLVELDRVMAIKTGRISPSSNDEIPSGPLALVDGRRMYESFLSRPEVSGGPCKSSKKRYRAVFDKFLAFAERRGVTSWNLVDEDTVNAYLNELAEAGYAQRSLYLEGTFIKQVLKYLANKRAIPLLTPWMSPLRKPTGSSTYCYSPEEVGAILKLCDETDDLRWLGHIVAGLAYTGLRISELASLRWSDIIESKSKLYISLSNDPDGGGATPSQPRRTKNRRDRTLPVHPDLEARLLTLPKTKDGPVFRGPRGRRLDPDHVRRVFASEVIGAQMHRFPSPSNAPGFKDGRLHSFRHYFCSVAANSGVPLKMLQAWLGHQQSSMIDIYYHLGETESFEKMSELRIADDSPRFRGDDASAAQVDELTTV